MSRSLQFATFAVFCTVVLLLGKTGQAQIRGLTAPPITPAAAYAPNLNPLDKKSSVRGGLRNVDPTKWLRGEVDVLRIYTGDIVNRRTSPTAVLAGQIRVNNDYGATVTIRLYHPAAPNQFHSVTGFAGFENKILGDQVLQTVIGGEWKLDIVFGNGVTSPARFVRDVASYSNGLWTVDATRIFNAQ